MQRVILFHYNAIELFPPALNLIRYLGSDKDLHLRVYTTSAPEGIASYRPDVPGRVEVIRLGSNQAAAASWRRMLSYAYFHIGSLLGSLLLRPTVIFYIESFSAVVPIMLKKWFFTRSKFFIHYHEYMSPSDYRRSGLLWRIYGWERQCLPKANWVSHTNEERMRMFLLDTGFNRDQLPVRIMPNYPSKDWVGRFGKREWRPGAELKLVYVGAVGFKSLYFTEIMEWVESMAGKCSLDVYSNQSTHEIEMFVKERRFQYTRFRQTVPYYNLPEVLCTYDIGLILYKGDSENFLHNAPNKLFEYLNVGLDVWFSHTLKGVRPYVQESIHPMVIPLDFEALSLQTTDSIYQNKSTSFQPVAYHAEAVYGPLKAAMLDE